MLALVLIAPTLLADEAVPRGFAAQPLPLYSAPEPDEAPIGQLAVAAPLRVLSVDPAGWRQVEVSGWVQEGGERLVQAAPGIRLRRAVLAPDGLGALRFGETRVHPTTGQVWTRTTFTGWLAADAKIRPDRAALWQRAETLFSERCTACHVRRVPDHYTAAQWASHLRVMGPRTGLPKSDQALILAFLQRHSSDAEALAAHGTEKGERSGDD